MKRLLSAVSLFAALSAFAFDVTSYVQDGLTANWDGLTRADDDTVLDAENHYHWTDLVGGSVFTLTNAAVRASGFYFNGGNANQGKGSYGVLPLEDTNKIFIPSTKKVTVEILLTCEGRGSFCSLRSTTASGIAVGMSSYDKETGRAAFTSTGHTKDYYPAVTDYPQATEVVTNTFAVTYTNAAPKSFYIDGVEIPFDFTAARVKVSSMNQVGTFIGAAQGGSYGAKQTICAVRVYNRVLGADEIAANSTVDKSRYLGIETATYEVGTNPVGVKGPNPPSGLYNTSLGADEVFSVADSMEDYDDDVRALALGEGHRIFLQNVLVQDGESDPEVKTAESFTHRIVDMKTSITWNFTNEQVLVVTATEGGGSISGKVGWVPAADETVTLTAVPTDGTRFFAWEGLPDGVGDPYAATLTLPLDRSYALKAKFVTQLYPGETYPGGYAFITANWTDPKSKIPAGADSASNDLEARFRTVGEFGAGDFDPNQVPGLLLLVR